MRRACRLAPRRRCRGVVDDVEQCVDAVGVVTLAYELD
jgi:hypothetical protein